MGQDSDTDRNPIEFLSWTSGSQSLNRPLGGRLRTYRPAGHRVAPSEHLDYIRKALLRGELAVNAFGRWRLLKNRTQAVHWTFVDAGETHATVLTERAIARREAGDISVVVADEQLAEQTAIRIDAGLEKADLLLAQRDWSRVRGDCPAFVRMIHLARRRGMTVHIVAAFGAQASDDDLYAEARRRWALRRNPLLRPAPRTSNIERRFGECLEEAGLNPVPQMPVACYYLDFALLRTSDGLPVRLDIEVDGRYWHEELPGRRQLRDERRDRVLRNLGWRPVRFWADDILRDEGGCLERVLNEAGSPEPLKNKNQMRGE